MSSPDDPEARIRDLERSLGAQSSELTQSSSEVGSGTYGGGNAPLPPPPPYTSQHPPYAAARSPYSAPPSYYGAPFPTGQMPANAGTGRGWIVYGVVAAVLMAVIGGTIVLFAGVFSNVDSIVDTFAGSPTASGGGGPFDAPQSSTGGNRPPVPAGPPGGDVSVAGIGEDKTIACNDSIVNVSGVSNTVVITGQCRTVSVSGVENTVTVDAAATISASGFNNRVTYLSGAPLIDNSGDSNTVEQG